MKLSLVVAEGVHKGKAIPVPVKEFVIGREEGCHLRPASPAISKRHCAILIKAGKIFVRDFGSTNGTFVNDQQVSGEIEVNNEDRIRVGPLEFLVRLVRTPGLSPSRDDLKPEAVSAPTPPPKDEPTKEEPTVGKKSDEEDPERIAAMLLGTDDGPPGPITEDKIPTGSTVFEIPAVDPNDPNAKKDTKNAAGQKDQDNSKKAAEILRKYMQRPRT